MCASRNSHNPYDWMVHSPTYRGNSRVPPFLHFTSTNSGHSPLAVKVENLAKTTRESDLRARLAGIHIRNIKVMECMEAPVNYAYVNCMDPASAQKAVDIIDEKMLLHQNVLRAKIKGAPKKKRSATTLPGQPDTKDICAVKTLIDDVSLTGEDVDVYFKKYGELSKSTIVRKGTPYYSYVNFVDPASAHKARSESPHTIKGVNVVAVPYKTERHGLGIDPTQGLLTMEFSCKPLAFAHAKKELQTEFTDNHLMKLDPSRGEKFVVHVQQPISEMVKNRVESVIHAHESAIETKELKLDFYNLPVLANLEIQKSIHDIKLPCQIKISRGKEDVNLGDLAANYSSRNNGSLEKATINQYVFAKTSDKESDCEPHWYWSDDTAFQPYADTVSDKIERNYRKKVDLHVDIGRFSYIIDPIKMTQVNTETRKKRKIQRKSKESPTKQTHMNIVLLTTAYKDHTAELHREIKQILSKSIDQATVKLSGIAVPTFKSFSGPLLDIARQNYVQANLEQDGCMAIILRGEKLLVKTTEVELQREMLKMEREKEKLTRMDVPDHWEPQTTKCELKEVAKGSPEWTKIKRQMEKPGFKVDILKIERIQNTWLWETYQMSKKRMSDKNDGVVNEKNLFHGPRQNEPKDIYNSEQGFDHRLASPGLFGEGTYFAVEAKYSNNYAYQSSRSMGSHQLFLANVITGISYRSTTSNHGLKVPPKKSEQLGKATSSSATKFEGERYDSVCGHTSNSEIYVIYELGRVYPAYLITYKQTHAYIF